MEKGTKGASAPRHHFLSDKVIVFSRYANLMIFNVLQN
jgi:hypothetical protein